MATTMAVYTTGAMPIYIQKMTQWTRDNWNYAGTYTDVKRLLDDAKNKKFAYVLVYSFGVLEPDVMSNLAALGVKVLAFKEQQKLEEELKNAKISDARSVSVRINQNSDYVEIKIPPKQK
ncbi:MAG: hypothetical protein QW751_00305 [Candidatus Aenigmatarchaeota archaeon]|nr:hypothetical protein [Candidatus Aenigmarchaeota archaeon]